MPKFDVQFTFTKVIDFGVIEAKNKKEAQEICEDGMFSDSTLIEEDKGEKWLIKKVKG